MPTVYERMKVIVADKLDVDEEAVVPSASFIDDLDADSLDLAELIMAFEEEFSSDENKIEISDEDAGQIMTLQDAIDYLKQHGIQDS
jgi:acyl carrier protein